MTEVDAPASADEIDQDEPLEHVRRDDADGLSARILARDAGGASWPPGRPSRDTDSRKRCNQPSSEFFRSSSVAVLQSGNPFHDLFLRNFWWTETYRESVQSKSQLKSSVRTFHQKLPVSLSKMPKIFL